MGKILVLEISNNDKLQKIVSSALSELLEVRGVTLERCECKTLLEALQAGNIILESSDYDGMLVLSHCVADHHTAKDEEISDHGSTKSKIQLGASAKVRGDIAVESERYIDDSMMRVQDVATALHAVAMQYLVPLGMSVMQLSCLEGHELERLHAGLHKAILSCLRLSELKKQLDAGQEPSFIGSVLDTKHWS